MKVHIIEQLGRVKEANKCEKFATLFSENVEKV